MEDQDTIAAKHKAAINKMSRFVRGEDPPESIPSDAAAEYMRGYSDGLAQAEETIAAAIQRAKVEEREACVQSVRSIAERYADYTDERDVLYNVAAVLVYQGK